MTDDTVTPVDIDDDLEAFENEFYGKTPEKEEEPEIKAEAEDVDENEDDALAPEDEDPEDSPEEDEEEEEPEEEPKPKKKGKSAKERIEELVAKAREAERREAELARRLEELEAQSKEVDEETPKGLREQLPQDAPNPDAVNDDGEPVYPLGEFDPTYIRDLTKWTIEQETKAAKERAAEEARQKEIEEAQKAIQSQWLENLEKAEEELPDIREKISSLTTAFENLDATYGEYLASTIMSSEFGPQIMYYLSQNIGEAQRIVASGPAAATLAIGRLEARFMTPKEEVSKRNKRVSEAPAPPEQRTRGHGGKFAVNPDTDDLEAFEREFFKG